ncbi:hypothetical protein [Actinokineospora sp.]|uniref:hypothetical protein n=1 Tax=Actinokineospora sp. TaxID=1872133 RepID=UPI003D6A4122
MDDTRISAELARAAMADSRELDRVCDAMALTLIDQGVEPPFEITSSDFAADAYLICSDRYWFHRFHAFPTIGTAAECARWIHEHVRDEHRRAVEQKWALGYAFVTRDSVESRTELAEATEDIVGADNSAGYLAYFTTLYHAGKLRANFRFDELHQFLDSSLLAMAAGAHREDPLFTALRSFAAFGSRAITVEHATALLERAWNVPERSRHVTDICVNGLAVAMPPFDGQGELLRSYAQQAVQAHPGDHMFHYRLASGQHMCGDHENATVNINHALVLLPATGRRGSHDLLQGQYMTKREAIQEGRLRALWAAQQQQRWNQQETANATLRDSLRSSAVRAMELVTVFTAAIAFAVGSLQVTLNGNLPLRDRLWLLAGFGGGLALFALLIIGGTWFITRTRGKR